MKNLDYQLFDIVEMKKEHPCSTRCKKFQIIRLGADLKIKCLGCGNVILIDRDHFNHRLRKILQHSDKEIFLEK